MSFDRVKAGLGNFVRGVFPRMDYEVLYPGRLIQQNGPNSFDFQPDNPRVPGVSGVPIRLPCPGIALTLDPSQSPRCILGFDNADPGKPFVALWEAPGLQAFVVSSSQKVSLVAPAINLGADPATEAVVKGTTYRTAEDVLLTALTAFMAAMKTYVGAIKAIADPSNAATPPMLAAITTMRAAIASFQGAAATYLSLSVKTA